MRYLVFAIALSWPLAAATTCESLANLALPRSTVTLAQAVAAGQLTLPAGAVPAFPGVPPPNFGSLPAICRVAATLKPTSDSDIKIEVWMPASGWNGKLEVVGNGAWAGSIGYRDLAAAVTEGWAVAGTDTGHTETTAAFVVGHPEKLIDFAYRAVHEMTLAAKPIVAAYYGKNPARMYFNGCSTGGRQALAEAQRYPNDYDGIVAGAAANYPTHLQGAQVWTTEITNQSDGYIPPAKYQLIHKAVLETCDALDGVKDGVLEDPRRCHFDPQALECKGPGQGGDSPTCLTPAQVAVARKIYAGPGASIFPGLERGSELGWATLSGPKPMALAAETYQYLVFKDPSWDYLKFDPVRDIATADKVAGPTMNSTDPNLKPFFSHGGKLLMYHGWADPGIAPENSVNYFTSVEDAMGGRLKASNSIRLFMVPGMGHCRGGDGTDDFDKIGTLATWVESNKAPDHIPAAHKTKGAIDRTRPLCPYPQTAHYRGSGSTDEAANFVCAAP
ncbi:MAG TPA: tannase/feruloyl esterase family alpha/beta hydrolase [Bryobacteraceae bacterium]|jgi:feruloyl esterase|nr:tannase/feruloyl esterase family alpha/beta hydrolase [Bryobacteraceae bacterium]